jgi:hypothetical protein
MTTGENDDVLEVDPDDLLEVDPASESGEKIGWFWEYFKAKDINGKVKVNVQIN